MLKGKLSGAATPTKLIFRMSDVISKISASLPDHVCCRPTVGPRWGSRPCYVEPAQANQGGRGRKARVDVVIFSTAAEREMQTDRGTQLALQLLGNQHSFRRELGKHKQRHILPPWGMRRRWPNSYAQCRWYCYFDGQVLPQTREDFDQRMSAQRGALAEVFQLTLSSLETVLKLRFEMIRELEQLQSPGFAPSVAILRAQLAQLVPKTIVDHPWRYLPSLLSTRSEIAQLSFAATCQRIGY